MNKWPSFYTADLGDTEADAMEMERRWEAYNRDMQALIKKGGVHQDEDGWWVDDATGQIIGPDPDIERPRTRDELAQAKPFSEAHPALAEAVARRRGRPKVDAPKEAVTLRLNPETVERFKASGPDWRTRMADVLEKGA